MKRLTTLIFIFLIGCVGNKTMKLDNGVCVPVCDRNFHYYYLSIEYNGRSTGYFVKGRGIDEEFARGDAKERLDTILRYCNLEDLKNVDNGDKIIEPNEFNRLGKLKTSNFKYSESLYPNR